MSPSQAYQAGTQAFNEKRYEQALEHLQYIQHPHALHLAAISAQKLGHTSIASGLFLKASKLAPNDPNIANNHGHFHLTNNDTASAKTRFESALKSAPNLPAALIGLAKIEATEKNWGAAHAKWSKVLQVSPGSAVSQYGLATALLELGKAEEAGAMFSTILGEGQAPEPLFMLGRAHLEQNQLIEAEACFRSSYEQAPTEHALRNLANLLWMRGDLPQFHSLIENTQQNLKPIAIRLLIESGDLDRAEHAWQAAYSETSPDKTAWLLKASLARELQNADDIAFSVDKALAFDAKDLVALDLRIVADLMLGQAEKALQRLAPLRSAYPQSQHWLAHEFSAHRMLRTNSPLLDCERFIRAYDLETPPGFESLRDFNTKLGATLKDLHTLQSRPLNQSLRGSGTQTIRSLTDHKHPIIEAYIHALDVPIQQYLSDIGRGASHPTSARNRGTYQFSGMWSVHLRGSGFHEKHVHPEGWISSAYYVGVPPGTDSSPEQAGWIGFGAPPYKVSPELSELKWIAPKPGRLVLFPSFMWHGTNPVIEQAERLTAPFDLIP